MIFNTFQGCQNVRRVELFSYCCIYHATIGEHPHSSSIICRGPDLEIPSRIKACKLSISYPCSEGDSQFVRASPLSTAEDIKILNCRRPGISNRHIANALADSAMLDIVPERVILETVPERVILEIVPELIPIAVVPECV